MDQFTVVRLFLKRSTCAKTQTAAGIFRGDVWVSAGHNLCAPEGTKYGEYVKNCPRQLMSTGVRYELCESVHAEVHAALSVRPGERSPDELARFAGHKRPSEKDILAAFTPEERQELWGATCYLVGHYYACDNCQHFLRMLGINDIKLDKRMAQQGQRRYHTEGITKNDDS